MHFLLTISVDLAIFESAFVCLALIGVFKRALTMGMASVIYFTRVVTIGRVDHQVLGAFANC